MKFENIRRMLSFARRAVDDYNMIEDGDRIAVGVSAGKDSLALLAGLAEMRRFYPKHYEVVGITVDMGFEGVDFTPIADLCRELDVPFVVVPTQTILPPAFRTRLIVSAAFCVTS